MKIFQAKAEDKAQYKTKNQASVILQRYVPDNTYTCAQIKAAPIIFQQWNLYDNFGLHYT
jgi:hypothetical protein